MVDKWRCTLDTGDVHFTRSAQVLIRSGRFSAVFLVTLLSGFSAGREMAVSGEQNAPIRAVEKWPALIKSFCLIKN